MYNGSVTGTPIIPRKYAARVLSGEITVDQALAMERGSDEPAMRREVQKIRQREQRGDDGLNQTERRYRDEVLEPQRLAGQIRDYRMPCPLKLRVGPSWRDSFEPDAMVLLASGEVELVDVKATMRERVNGGIRHRPLTQEDAAAKIKAAAVIHPYFGFVVAYPIPRKDGGGWARKEIR